jgi:hypothetical protein
VEAKLRLRARPELLPSRLKVEAISKRNPSRILIAMKCNMSAAEIAVVIEGTVVAIGDRVAADLVEVEGAGVIAEAEAEVVTVAAATAASGTEAKST